ncbi:MAG: hypothetical protein Q7J54_02845 [Candidatus Woesearchaeota archaeon]|nr:hypothetical protein [Candidatus Woesearchaeota archaeon]
MQLLTKISNKIRKKLSQTKVKFWLVVILINIVVFVLFVIFAVLLVRVIRGQ